MKIVQIKTELNFLRSQITPHFMFNLMNTLVLTARKKPELVEPSLISLSQLIRYMLYESEDIKISLQDEIEYLESYINLQLLRFGDHIKFNFFLSGVITGHHIEPMMVIPLIENAFKHGTGIKEESTIDVIITVNEDKFKVIVKNIRDQKKTKAPQSGIGLTNVRRRLELLYPERHNIVIDQGEDNFTVNLEISL